MLSGDVSLSAVIAALAALSLSVDDPPAPAPAPPSQPPAALGNAPAPTAQDSGSATGAANGPKVSLKAAAEGTLVLLPSGFGENGLDVLVGLRPVAGFGVGEVFSIELGPTLRLRLIDTPPDNRATDYGGALRRADWDELSDFGQILQSLRIGEDGGVFTLRANPLTQKTLGFGHLVNRYSNVENADYHPTGADAVLAVGPIRAEVLASDILGLRLFAGELGWDLGRTFSPNQEVWNRFVLALEVAHDFGRAGLPFRPDPAVAPLAPLPVTLLQLDASATVLRSKDVRLTLLGGFGSRADSRADIGFLGGAALDATVGDIGFSLKLELRKQAGGFRQGFFGPTYELSRFDEYGFHSTPRAELLLPDGWSSYAELRLGVGTMVSADLSGEYFFWGRTDLDAHVNVVVLNRWLVAQARFALVGLGVQPRTSLTAGAKLRLLPAFYLLADAGTVFFPQPDGSLLRGFTASAGVGVDFER